MGRGIHNYVSLAILACVTLLADVASADSLRCGKWVLNESPTKDELLKKCGEPKSRDVTQEDVVAQNPSGARVKTGVKTTERWIYQPSSRSLPMAVVIVDEKIVSIERAK
jgi:hypothetical protein